MARQRVGETRRGDGALRVALRRLGFVLQGSLCLFLLVWMLLESQLLLAGIAALLGVGATVLLVRDLRGGG